VIATNRKHPNPAVRCRGNLRRSGRRGCQLKEWEERVYVRLGYINIILKFSEELEPTDQIYSHIANEIHSSDVNSHIVEQTENSVIVRLEV